MSKPKLKPKTKARAKPTAEPKSSNPDPSALELHPEFKLVLKTELGNRYNAKKPRLSLLDPDALIGLVKVLESGTIKYSAHNWRKGLLYTETLDSLLRHVLAILRGEDIDPESGLPHIDHVGCNWMFLSHYMKHYSADLDDRYKYPDTNTSDKPVLN